MLINKSGIPVECPSCHVKPREGEEVIEIVIRNWSEVSRDGDVCCANCGRFIRPTNT